MFMYEGHLHVEHAGMYEWMNEISQFGDMLWSGSES